MRLAVMEFNQLEVDNTDSPSPATMRSTYVECRLIDPPIDFAVGVGNTVSEAFADMQSRIIDTAIYSARLLHDDPEEWKRRSESEPKSESERPSELRESEVELEDDRS